MSEKIKSIKKSTLDDLIKHIRKYWETGDKDYLALKHLRADELSKQAFDSDLQWNGFCDLVDGVYRFKQDFTNEFIYALLLLLGFQIEEAEE